MPAIQQSSARAAGRRTRATTSPPARKMHPRSSHDSLSLRAATCRHNSPFPSCPARRSQVSRLKRAAPRVDTASAPDAVRTANSLPLPSMSTSGGRTRIVAASPAAMPNAPHRRHLRRHRHNHSPPSAMAAKPHVGIAGSRVTAPGQAETVPATRTTTSIPQPMAASDSPSSPSGMRRNVITAQGMIHNAVTGTATRLAARP